jgi:geranylgeranyl diphosphate synthase type II
MLMGRLASGEAVMTTHCALDMDRGSLREGKPPSVRAPDASLPTLDLEAYLPARRAQVEALLLDHLAGLSPSAPPLLRRAVRYSLLTESQRMRPVLCLAVAEAVSGTSTPHRVVEDAACALELIQTCSWIYQDAFGDSLATQAGEALLLEAFHLVARGPERVRARLSHELATGTGLMGTHGEELADLTQNRAARLEYLLQLRWMKTGGFLRASCRMGALAAGGNEEALARADLYGDAVGTAFLIGDDLRNATREAPSTSESAWTRDGDRRLSFASMLGLKTSRAIAFRKVAEAIATIEPLEGPGGPLAAIARSALERLPSTVSDSSPAPQMEQVP